MNREAGLGMTQNGLRQAQILFHLTRRDISNC